MADTPDSYGAVTFVTLFRGHCAVTFVPLSAHLEDIQNLDFLGEYFLDTSVIFVIYFKTIIVSDSDHFCVYPANRLESHSIPNKR